MPTRLVRCAFPHPLFLFSLQVTDGGAELQQMLDWADAPLAVVHWAAGWAPAACGPAGEALAELADRLPPSRCLILEACPLFFPLSLSFF